MVQYEVMQMNMRTFSKERPMLQNGTKFRELESNLQSSIGFVIIRALSNQRLKLHNVRIDEMF